MEMATGRFCDEFSTYHPINNMIFFFGAIIMGMCFLHPVFVIVNLLASIIYLFIVKKRKAFKDLLWLVVVFAIITFINPFFNTAGKTVLFRIFITRPYTLEALIYGIALGGMAASILSWFACYNAIMTSDKFIFAFAKLIPSISLILSMILRLIPNLIRKTKQISNTRACIGMAGNSSASSKEKLKNGAVILSTLTSWSLEGGIITADSMKARGYGAVKKRTSFVQYKFDLINIVFLVIQILLICTVIFCAVNGGTFAEYTPVMKLTWFGDWYMLIGLIVYTIFLCIPSLLDIKEIIKWQILKSKI